MIELKKNIFLEIDDNEVLSLIKNLRRKGLNIPDFQLNGNDQSLFVVEFDAGFNLYFFLYSAKQNDAGYLAVYIKNFLSKNKFNLLELNRWGFNVAGALSQIHEQVMGIAKRINYPLQITTVIKKDFVGLVTVIPTTN